MNITDLYFDLLVALVFHGEIRGKDLVSLCVSNSKINRRFNSRNQQIFRSLLWNEFGIRKVKNSRDKYFELSRGYEITIICDQKHRSMYFDGNRTNVWDDFNNIKQVSCGNAHMAIIDTNNKIWTFGNNVDYGQLGHNNINIPTMIEGFDNITQVSCGIYHTAMIDTNGQIWTFGRGDEGQLGHGTAMTRLTIPTPIANFNNVKQVSCGCFHTAIIDTNGQIWTFGKEYNGRLGHGDKLNRQKPTMIEGFNNIVQVSCGGSHTAMIDTNGQIWTFGYGYRGRLGHGDKLDRQKPTMIEGFNNIVQVSCGSCHTAMIDTNGQIWTFGNGSHGRLGHGDTNNRFKPTPIEGFSNIVQVSCGACCVMMIDDNAQGWFFGNGGKGPLYHYDGNDRMSPTLMEGTIRQVSCGRLYNVIKRVTPLRTQTVRL